METNIHKIMWLVVDGLMAIGVIKYLQQTFFQGGITEVVYTLAKGLGI